MPYWSPDDLLDELGIHSPEDLDVEAIAQHCDATVVYEPLSGCEARILGVGDRAIITVNSTSRRERQRFSAAHELGHWAYDRGQIAISCTERSVITGWSPNDPERRANRYATDLLLPAPMFTGRAENQDITFSTVGALAETFQTSLTATAIRLVELGSYPSLVTCYADGRRKWYLRNEQVPTLLKPKLVLNRDTIASDVLRGKAGNGDPEDVGAQLWFDLHGSRNYEVREDSRMIVPGVTLTLLWWKNERQIVDLTTEE